MTTLAFGVWFSINCVLWIKNAVDDKAIPRWGWVIMDLALATAMGCTALSLLKEWWHL